MGRRRAIPYHIVVQASRRHPKLVAAPWLWLHTVILSCFCDAASLPGEQFPLGMLFDEPTELVMDPGVPQLNLRELGYQAAQ